MKRNDQNNPQGFGYPQQNGYPQDIYQGYSAPQGYQAPQGYPQAPGYTQAFTSQAQGFSRQPGMNQAQGYQQATGYQPAPGYQAGRNYQTPQVPVTEPPAAPAAAPSYGGQQPYPQGSYTQPGAPAFGQAQPGYPGQGWEQQNGYPRQNGTGYGYGGNQQQSPGSYIPQMPSSYTQAYTAQGYPAAGGYQQGYGAYNTQMGRNPQPAFFPNQDAGQVPLNGGGYVPQKVPVRKMPFELPDLWLLIISAVLLILFALGMFASGMSFMKWVFIVLAAGASAALWIRPMTDTNKRLCFTVVFGLLVLVSIIGVLTGGTGAKRTAAQQSAVTQAGAPDPTQVPEDYLPAVQAAVQAQAAPTQQPTQDMLLGERAKLFLKYWSTNNYDEMLKLCSPNWISQQDDARQKLFQTLGIRTPVGEAQPESVSGTEFDTSRTVYINTEMSHNDGRDENSWYKLPVMMVKENDIWYIQPESLRSNVPTVTPAMPTISPPPTPTVKADTPLYYNPNGGSYYHIDPYCKAADKKLLPFQGVFTYAELNNPPYNQLERCNVCGAPFKDD